MIRNLVVGLTLAVGAGSAWADTGVASARSLPMQFEWWQEGPAGVCGAQCRTWVSAVGTITAETPHDFSEFARTHDLRGVTLVLDSGGGSVHGAIALGRKIRQFAMVTSVGKTIELARRPGATETRAMLSPQADCESMCVFALLGGTTRLVPHGARVLVHQIWLGDRRDDAAAATYSAEDLVLVQRDIGRLAQYTAEMGGSVDFLELTLRIPPWEPMRALTRDEIRRMHVEAGPQWTPPAAIAKGTSASSPAQLGGMRRGPEAAARGWIVVERGGDPVLMRNHPLTVEGEEIGSFDLTLACGEGPDSIAVVYSEQRITASGAAEPVRTVSLSIGARTEPLQVVSSELVPRSLELSTQARGSVPVSFMRSFLELSNRSLAVSTMNAADTRTAIRVGNSGSAPAFARLRDNCRSRPLHATNARTASEGGR